MNSRSNRIEIKHFAFICTNCTRMQICTRIQINNRVQIKLHHLESRSKFPYGCKFIPGCKFLKRRSHGQKCTRVQIVHINPALVHSFHLLFSCYVCVPARSLKCIVINKVLFCSVKKLIANLEFMKFRCNKMFVMLAYFGHLQNRV